MRGTDEKNWTSLGNVPSTARTVERSAKVHTACFPDVPNLAEEDVQDGDLPEEDEEVDWWSASVTRICRSRGRHTYMRIPEA